MSLQPDLSYEYTTGKKFTKKRHIDTYHEIDPVTQSNHIGRHVLVTGAAGEVGTAMAISFARAGASAIVVTDMVPISDDGIKKIIDAGVKAGRSTPPKVVALQLDITSFESAKQAKEKVESELDGRLDILVNNAGVLNPYERILDLKDEVNWRTFEVNVHGIFNMTQNFLPMILATKASKGGLGTIVNVSSVAALSIQKAGGAYGSSKHTILRWTEHAALEYGDQGLLTFSIQPGLFSTKLARGLPEAIHSTFDNKVEMPADTVVYLTQKRREWLSGRYVDCAWDMAEFLTKEREIVEGDKLKMRMVF